jgi:DNA-binding transcriptional LysR family regulator
MTIQQLIYFRCVAKSLSFTKAAKECFVSQTSISRQIAQLEKELQVRLIERNTAHVSLTPAGRYFYEACDKSLTELSQSVERAREIAHASNDHLTIGIPSILEQHAIAPKLKAFHNTHPDVAIRSVALTRQELVTAMVNGQVDLMVALAFDLPEINRFRVKSLAHEHSVWLLPVTHPLAHKQRISPADLHDDTLILTNENPTAPTLERLNNYYRSLGLEDNKRIVTSDLSETFMLISAGIGISLMPSGVKKWISPDLVCAEIDGPQWEMDYLLISLANTENGNANVAALMKG